MIHVRAKSTCDEGQIDASLTHLVSGRGKQMLPTNLRRCIADCGDCQGTCLGTVAHCLTLGGKYTEAQHIRVMLDCAEICQVAANFMLRRSTLHSHVCRACAEISEACARSCDALANGDEQIRQCVESCRRCAQSCREMGELSHIAA